MTTRTAITPLSVLLLLCCCSGCSNNTAAVCNTLTAHVSAILQSLSAPAAVNGGSIAITVHADATAAKLSPVKEHLTPVKGAVPGHSRASSSGGCSSSDGDLAPGDAACSSAVADGAMAEGRQQVPWNDRIGAIRGSACNSPARHPTQPTGVDSWPSGPVSGGLGVAKASDDPQVWENTAYAHHNELTTTVQLPCAGASAVAVASFVMLLDVGTNQMQICIPACFAGRGGVKVLVMGQSVTSSRRAVGRATAMRAWHSRNVHW